MPKLNKKTMIIIGVGAAAVLLLLYLRSRAGSSSSNTSPTDTMGTTSGDTGSGYADLGGQLQQQAANEGSDIASLTDQLNALAGQEASDIAGINATISGLSSGDTGGNAPVTNPTSPTPTSQTRMSVLSRAAKAAGAIAAPFGAKKPSGVPAGYHVVGLGGGNWAYEPTTKRNPQQHPKTGRTKRDRDVANHQANNHPAGTAGHAVAPRSHAPARARPPAASLTGLHPVVNHPTSASTRASRPVQSKAKPPANKAKGRKK